MTNHASAGREVAARVAGQIRAEMARQRCTTADLAACLGVSPHTAGRRLSGRTDFTAVDLVLIADWLSVNVGDLLGKKASAA